MTLCKPKNMAEGVVIPRNQSSPSFDYKTDFEFRYAVDRANTCLMYKQFDECLQVCCEHIARARNFIEEARAREFTETLVAVAIQAYAELDRWLEVVPFVSQTYDGLEDCPALIAKLCLALHADVGDFVTCTVITSIWMKNPKNFSSPEYKPIAEFYIEKVLLKNERWSDVRPFLDSCPGIDEAAKQKFLRQFQKTQQQMLEAAANRIEVITDKTNGTSFDCTNQVPSDIDRIASGTGQLPDRLQRVLNVLRSWYKKFPLVVPFRFVQYAVVAVAAAYIFWSKWGAGLRSSAFVARLLAVLEMLWRGMFAPLHMINR